MLALFTFSRATAASALAYCSLLAPGPTAWAQAPPKADPLAEIRQAMGEKLPQVAATKAKRLLESEKLTGDVATKVRLLLAEALIRSDASAEAVTILAQEHSPEALFWRAAALQKLGKLSEALRVWQVLVLPTGSPMAATAKLNHISCHAALAQFQQALDLVKAVQAAEAAAASPKPQAAGPGATRLRLWEAELLLKMDLPAAAEQALGDAPPGAEKATWLYLIGKSQLGQGEASQAVQTFRQVLAEDLPQLASSATLGLARALRLAEQTAEAVKSLATFISGNPESLWLEEAFDELRACNDPLMVDVQKQLATWAAAPSEALASQAAYALLQQPAGQTTTERLSEIAKFSARFSASPLLPRVQLQRVGLLIAENRFPEAKNGLAALDPANLPEGVKRLRLEMDAYLAYAEEDYSAAAETFANLAKTAEGPEEKLRAAYNNALATMQNGGNSDLLVNFTEGMPNKPTQEWAGTLQLEKSLQSAAEDDREAAVAGLKQFLGKNPKHPRRFDALLAMAELLPLETAWMAELRQTATTPTQKQATELLDLELQAAGPLEPYLKNVNDYLTANPGAAEAAQLWFRSGEVCFNKQQLVEAEIRFSKAATASSPESVMAAAAHYWAGKAAMGSMNLGSDDVALKHWASGSAYSNPFRHKARIAQARLHQRRNEPDQALAQLAGILADKTPPPEAETRYAVLCLRSELLAGLPKVTSEQLSEALKHCESVSTAPGASVSWKQEASFRRAGILELQRRPPEALEAYYATMNPPITPQPILTLADYHWFLRAGEKALAILEAQKDWKGALAIAQKMGQAPGALGEAARTKAERLKTQHLIWEDEATP